MRGQQLHGHVSAEARVARAVNSAHANRAEGRDDFAGAESGVGGQGHGWSKGGRTPAWRHEAILVRGESLTPAASPQTRLTVGEILADIPPEH